MIFTHFCYFIFIASREGHLDVVKYLVDKGAQLDIQDNDDGWTALIWGNVILLIIDPNDDIHSLLLFYFYSI